MGFVIEKVTMAHVCFSLLQLSPVNIIPPTLHSRSLIYHRSSTP